MMKQLRAAESLVKSEAMSKIKTVVPDSQPPEVQAPPQIESPEVKAAKIALLGYIKKINPDFDTDRDTLRRDATGYYTEWMHNPLFKKGFYFFAEKRSESRLINYLNAVILYEKIRTTTVIGPDVLIPESRGSSDFEKALQLIRAARHTQSTCSLGAGTRPYKKATQGIRESYSEDLTGHSINRNSSS